MEEMQVSRYMKLLEPLSRETKLAILSKLSLSLQKEKESRKQANKLLLLEEVAGAWKDTKEDLVSDILSSRTLGDKEINLDYQTISPFSKSG